jgi:hypothetical protein
MKTIIVVMSLILTGCVAPQSRYGLQLRPEFRQTMVNAGYTGKIDYLDPKVLTGGPVSSGPRSPYWSYYPSSSVIIIPR